MREYEIEITNRGYLRISAETARALFPDDSLIVMYRDDQLLLLPTRGPAGGGLLLKQYNTRGDRSVLITEVLPTSGDNEQHLGTWRGTWDTDAHALRVPLGVVP